MAAFAAGVVWAAAATFLAGLFWAGVAFLAGCGASAGALRARAGRAEGCPDEG
ncbi:hypothetical protein [Paractinoplanes abujensis]|uniref:Uncharacterized protein n=1 Tax=Paractinoplanes abujensis TaxID=882441 RepID=A0A7W7G4T0_9ACTN|nr:hypothetical protein [Actinoplanes abujensis]MBB4696232.1 hypothetical protein [Actinoplanes abujensis]